MTFPAFIMACSILKHPDLLFSPNPPEIFGKAYFELHLGPPFYLIF